jgi:hypothetical protein
MKSRLEPSKNVLFFLGLANIILLSAGWVMALRAYPRLPSWIPIWMNFLDQQIMLTSKSGLFFVYPLTQTLFCLAYGCLIGVIARKRRNSGHEVSRTRLKQEFALLALIFFNLIFIHLQRSIILTAHGLEEGISKSYFFSLFGIIMVLIPYYRIRTRLITKKINPPENTKKI